MNPEIQYPYNSEFGNKPAENFAVLNGFETIHDVVLEIKNAKQRVSIQFMANYAGHAQDILFNALIESAQRGISTSLTLDWFSKSISYDGMPPYLLLSPTGEGTKIRSLYRNAGEVWYEKLEKAGVELKFQSPREGLRGLVMPGGKIHRKSIVVDDTSYVGGVQPDNASFKGHDFTVKITDRQLADELVKTQQGQTPEDYSIELESGDTLYVDSGKKGESIILDRAIEVINKTSEPIFVASEFVPHGEFRDALYEAAQRGIPVFFFHSDPKVMWLLAKPLTALLNFQGRNKPVPTHFLPERYIHAKLVMTGRTALFGTHNYSPVTVNQGTAEIALETQNPQILNNLEANFQRMHEN